ncbi:LTA synthase family protein [Pseudalkalibacillus berkeleyi]|uniref:LTA synthase family protein n=1 Tax=Pseudalkalibacillus berkeleyi TaxID=1069813 RepID=A0ABS9H3B2_9BACL|nr:LTA synthase family protein [Pseudalkalibacillus berkeleyi]MCF6139374.1 LTA synthase family protein [Pseudalkalibacillus berkeleyi]
MKERWIRNSLVITATILWIKTYVVYKLSFNLPTSNWIQELILIINPLSSVIFTMALVFLFPKKLQKRMTWILALIFSIVLYSNTLYYRFFNDFITVPVLFQTNNVGDIGNSLVAQTYWYDIFFFLDIIVISYFVKRGTLKPSSFTNKSFMKLAIIATLFLAINLGLAESERPQLLTRTFDRELLVKNLGTYNYHVYDLLLQSKTKAQKALANNSDVEEIIEYTKNKDVPVNDELYGIAEGKNIILISMESTQQFVIGKEVRGKEITPFLNDFIKDSYYFDNFYHQTGQGKTSDSEFLLDNSLYPLPRGAVFQTHPLNEYFATPEILKKQGYHSAVFHGNNKSFWNRDIMYNTMGYDEYISQEYYTINENNQINYGLKDRPFFKQSMDYLSEMSQPFYSRFITLTNHHPYKYDESDQLVPTFETNDPIVDRYPVTVSYTDKAIKEFIGQLKANGLYENSVIIIYGDHYGISERHNDALAQVLNKEEITPYDNVQLQRVPLIIHIPGQKGKTISKVSGQIDLKPTILNLLGIGQQGIQFGTDLFSEQHKNVAIFRDRSVVTDAYVYTKDTCYDRASGAEVNPESCTEAQQHLQELELSDSLIYGDLLRFLNMARNN